MMDAAGGLHFLPPFPPTLNSFLPFVPSFISSSLLRSFFPHSYFHPAHPSYFFISLPSVLPPFIYHSLSFLSSFHSLSFLPSFLLFYLHSFCPSHLYIHTTFLPSSLSLFPSCWSVVFCYCCQQFSFCSHRHWGPVHMATSPLFFPRSRKKLHPHAGKWKCYGVWKWCNEYAPPKHGTVHRCWHSTPDPEYRNVTISATHQTLTRNSGEWREWQYSTKTTRLLPSLSLLPLLLHR